MNFFFQAKTHAAADALLNTNHTFLRVPKILLDAKRQALRAGIRPPKPDPKPVKPTEPTQQKSERKDIDKERQEASKLEEIKG